MIQIEIMNIVFLIAIIVAIIVGFEFIKHHFIKSSGKSILTLVIIILIVFLIFQYTDFSIDTSSITTTGASIIEDIKDGLDNFDLDVRLDSFNTRKVYIADIELLS